MRTISLALLCMILFVAGCSTPQEPLESQPSPDGATVEDLQQDLTGLDTLDEELDISDLEGIEDDLNADF